MEKFPHIFFKKRENPKLQFEIISLSELFKRSEKLNHILQNHHRVDFYHIFYFTKGNGTHHVDFISYNYYPGTILFVSKGQVHAFDINPQRDGYVLIFTEAFLSKNVTHADVSTLYRLYNYYLHPPVLHETEIAQEKLNIIIHSIYEEYIATGDVFTEDMLRLWLKLILLKVERIQQTLAPEVKNSEWIVIFNSFKSLVENNFTKTRNANDYAQMLGISYKHLNEVCKSLTGNSAKRFIDILVVLEIKRHLGTSGLSINELSCDIGFDEPTNLIKFFKKHAGCSPTHYRKMLKK